MIRSLSAVLSLAFLSSACWSQVTNPSFESGFVGWETPGKIDLGGNNSGGYTSHSIVTTLQVPGADAHTAFIGLDAWAGFEEEAFGGGRESNEFESRAYGIAELSQRVDSIDSTEMSWWFGSGYSIAIAGLPDFTYRVEIEVAEVGTGTSAHLQLIPATEVVGEGGCTVLVTADGFVPFEKDTVDLSVYGFAAGDDVVVTLRLVVDAYAETECDAARWQGYVLFDRLSFDPESEPGG